MVGRGTALFFTSLFAVQACAACGLVTKLYLMPQKKSGLVKLREVLGLVIKLTLPKLHTNCRHESNVVINAEKVCKSGLNFGSTQPVHHHLPSRTESRHERTTPGN